MFNFDIQVKELDTKINPDKEGFVVAKNGIFEKINNSLYKAIVPTKNIPIISDQEPSLELKMKKIPLNVVQEGVNILYCIYEKYNTEGCVILFFNTDYNKYRNYLPKQEVGGASVTYEDVPAGSTFGMNTMQMGTIHSHPGSAFHSGTDDKDEKTFDGIHLTYGNLLKKDNKILFTISASIMINGHRFKIEPEKIVEDIPVESDKRFYSVEFLDKENIDIINNQIKEKITRKEYKFMGNQMFGNYGYYGNQYNRGDNYGYYDGFVGYLKRSRAFGMTNISKEELKYYKEYFENMKNEKRLIPRNEDEYEALCEGILSYFMDTWDFSQLDANTMAEDLEDDICDVDMINEYLLDTYDLLDIYHGIELEKRKKNNRITPNSKAKGELNEDSDYWGRGDWEYSW